MNIKKLFLTASLAICATLAGYAQSADEETEYVFKPNWYIQGQVGMQETLGETSFGRLGSFNAQLGVGYRFNPVLGARLIFNGLTSKGSITIDNERSDWKWNYLAPTADLTVDMTNLIGGFNPYRRVSAGIFAGLGANIAWKNDEANTVNEALKGSLYGDIKDAAQRPNVLRDIWTGTKTRFVGQFGVYCDYNVSKNVAIGIELQANVLPDTYNSKRACNADWYFNGLVGVKYTFGTTFSNRKKVARAAATTNTGVEVVERIVEVPVEKIVEKVVVKEVPAPLSRDIFFKISNTKISKDEMYKVAEVARYMQNNPNTTVTITGYADKGTGSRQLNLRLSAQRANTVAETLTKNYGIAADRIVVKSMGDEEHQPYNTPELNRVAICIVE